MKKFRLFGMITLLLMIGFTSCRMNRTDPPTEPFIIIKSIYIDDGYTEYVFASTNDHFYRGRFMSFETYSVGDTLCFMHLTVRTTPIPKEEPKDEPNEQ